MTCVTTVDDMVSTMAASGHREKTSIKTITCFILPLHTNGPISLTSTCQNITRKCIKINNSSPPLVRPQFSNE